MSQNDSYPDDPAVQEGDEDPDEAVLKTRIAVLEEENARLKQAYGSARRSQYRRTALGLLTVGLLATGAGFLLPSVRDVLFALGGTGLFAGVLTYYLTPEQFIAASVGEQVYSSLVANGTGIAAELGLSGVSVYVPPSVGETLDSRLFVPQRDDYELPDSADLGRTFVVADQSRRGVAFHPSGEGLYEEFERALTVTLADRPEPLADQLADAVVEQFELAGGVRTDVDESGGRATVEVAESFFGPIDRFDHPVPSFVAVGLARALDRAVEVEATRTDDGEYLLTYDWETETSKTAAAAGSAESAEGNAESAAARPESAEERTGSAEEQTE